MELLTIILSGILAIAAPINAISDQVIAGMIRKRLTKTEQLAVRIDNAPNYQLVLGKVERVRVAGRGLWPTPYFRIASVGFESDPINVNLREVRKMKGLIPSPNAIRSPLGGALSLEITEEDLNNALKSPEFQAILKKQLGGLAANLPGAEGGELQIINPKIDLLDNNRVRIEVAVKIQGIPEELKIKAETGIGVDNGKTIRLVSPDVSLNDRSIPGPLISAVASEFLRKLDLGNLEKRGVTARILQVKMTNDKFSTAIFALFAPPANPSGSTTPTPTPNP